VRENLNKVNGKSDSTLREEEWAKGSKKAVYVFNISTLTLTLTQVTQQITITTNYTNSG
jgi:hypothetical protein